MPRWDYICIHCGNVQKNVTMSNWAEATGRDVECPDCHAVMQRQPSAPNFTVRGYNAANNYGVKK